MHIMQNTTKWYLEQPQQQNNLIVPKLTIVHPCLYVMAVTEVKQTPNSVFNINQSWKVLRRHHICLTNYVHDFTLDEIKRRDTI